MPQITANGLQLEYEDYGDKSAPPILLVMGLGAQLTLWPMELVDALVERGFRVIRYDNRDIGLSHKFEGAKAPGILKLMIFSKFGLPIRTPYSLADMAADGAALLDALGIEKAHIVGASMGGMITQHIGFSHPEKVLSLTSIMSTTGNPKLDRAKPEAIKALTTRPADAEIETIREHGLKLSHAIGSPGYRADPEVIKDKVELNFRRSFYPAGLPRQLAAIIADGCRRTRLGAITAPTLVVHGEDDPLVPLSGGKDTAAHIPGASLKTFPGMGHDLPVELVEPMADAIAEHAKAV
ncbi:alpha/beta hydrolase [Pontixanthobacter gangjinensis]|uniref:Alpha/beta fold hydrolase n=1 Tax=Pontixanthobacter gangjinensis TaxID=1028742 RepID=A0A6I4SLE9_9SPHN|nr:alpha/beta fold hydrolase [Pontixanthobacter gangjinensis]MXO55986.1 alpha/beta fold hydrolase [Pontixanthobacter gangjinensis]